MYKTFIQALLWNSSSAFIYKIALLFHQILLYSIISSDLYGVQSTLFALIYTIIAVTNFGFEETLLSFFSQFSENKSQFMQLWYYLLWHTIAIIGVMICFYTILLYGPGAFLHKLRAYCNRNLIFIITMIFGIESLKKTIISILQLAFLQKQIAYAEMSMLLTYMSIIWFIYGIYGQLTLHNIFIPMLITATVECLYFLYHAARFSHTLPDQSHSTNIHWNIIAHQRIYNYINQIIKTMYSPNSMTIVFAYILGFQQAATIKFFTNIITLCYTCISKSIGVTVGAAFATMKNMPLPSIQFLFKDITYRYLQFLYILSCIMITILGYSYMHNYITKTMAIHISLFFIISFLEHVTITYEQLFISQQAAQLLTIINCIGFTLLMGCGLIYYVYISNPIVLFFAYITIKMLLLHMMRSLAKKHWGISSL